MKLTIITKIRETCTRFLQPTRSECKACLSSVVVVVVVVIVCHHCPYLLSSHVSINSTVFTLLFFMVQYKYFLLTTTHS